MDLANIAKSGDLVSGVAVRALRFLRFLRFLRISSRENHGLPPMPLSSANNGANEAYGANGQGAETGLAAREDWRITFPKSRVMTCSARSPYSPLCKIQGTEPQISRFFCLFFVILRFFDSFLPSEDKNPPSAISCSRSM